LRQAGIPVSRSPENAACALVALREVGLTGQPSLPNKEPSFPGGFRDRAMALLCRADPSGALAEPETRDLLVAAGFDIPESLTVARADEAAEVLWAKVALKLIVPGLVHRSDSGAVLLNLNGKEEIRRGAAELFNRCSDAECTKARLLVTPMIEPGLELLCGAFRDPQFGPMIMVGLGGVQVEAMDDVVIELAPLSHAQALQLIARIRAQPLLDGHRGAAAVDRDQLAKLLTKLGDTMQALPVLSEIEMNPVIVTAGGLQMADARASVSLEVLG